MNPPFVGLLQNSPAEATRLDLPGSQGARDAGGTFVGRWHPAAGRDFHVPAWLSTNSGQPPFNDSYIPL